MFLALEFRVTKPGFYNVKFMVYHQQIEGSPHNVFVPATDRKVQDYYK